MAEENQNAGGLLLLHNAMEQQESKAQWQPRQQQQASLPYQGTGGAASGHTPCGAPSAGDPAGAAAKAAAIREKNRLAQQRFRERQRLKEAEADEQCAALQLQIDEVAAERDRLQRQGIIMCKVLAVRDAMLHTFATLQLDKQNGAAGKPRPALGEPAQEAAQEAAQGLARALQELPSESEMGAAANAQQASPRSSGLRPAALEAQQHGVERAAQGQQAPLQRLPAQATLAGTHDSPDSSTAAVEEQAQVRMQQWTLGEPHRSGVASHLDGSALREVESIPPACDEAVVAMVQAWTQPDQLVDYFREWQADLKARYDEARQAGFDSASVAEVEAVQDRMTQVWWHVGQLKPAFLCYLAHTLLPENSGQLPLWREIAVEVMQHMDERSVGIVRQSWINYSKRMAKIAVGVSRWVKRLQEYAVQPAEGLVTNAHKALELVEILSHMAAAVQEEYITSMEFVAAQFPATSTLTKAYVNYRSAPHLPDLVAIVSAIVQLDNERRHAEGLYVGPVVPFARSEISPPASSAGCEAGS